ncbi:MAG TPA: zinc-ribbon domain-containing protein [Candidatus Methanoperedenaceae archaeon]|nr:zinc-ribbon domain-containing protein [Candidatus Methanoperedenaceae archaeon]
MAYCPKCGKKNEDEATYCNSCGASLRGGRTEQEREWADNCAGGPRFAPIIWGAVLILIGLAILVEGVLKNIPGMPAWVNQIDFGWIAALIIGLLFIIWGITRLSRR